MRILMLHFFRFILLGSILLIFIIWLESTFMFIRINSEYTHSKNIELIEWFDNEWFSVLIIGSIGWLILTILKLLFPIPDE